MADPHFNIFHAYRGPRESADAGERQLEDNLTRALIVTLNTIRNSKARFDVLRALQIPEDSLERPYRCRLQVTKEDTDWPARAQRRLIVIHEGPELKTKCAGSNATRGRADATVAFSNFVVAIESKLTDEVTQAQLDRHFRTLAIPRTTPGSITWAALAQTCRTTSQRHSREPVVRFILEQFEEYLRMNGFGGLTADHFAFFASTAEDRDPLVKEGIRRVLRQLGGGIKDALGTQWDIRLLNITAGATDGGVVLEPASKASRTAPDNWDQCKWNRRLRQCRTAACLRQVQEGMVAGSRWPGRFHGEFGKHSDN